MKPQPSFWDLEGAPFDRVLIADLKLLKRVTALEFLASLTRRYGAPPTDRKTAVRRIHRRLAPFVRRGEVKQTNTLGGIAYYSAAGVPGADFDADEAVAKARRILIAGLTYHEHDGHDMPTRAARDALEALGVPLEDQP